jgi:hypothetical protein
MANDYGTLGYNSQLNASDSLAAKPIEQSNPLNTETIIERGAISTTMVSAEVGSISDLSITTAKLADAAVITSKIGTNSITTAQMVDLAITADKVANGAVSADKISGSAILGTHLTNLIVDANKLAGSAVIAGKVGTGAVGSLELQNACIGSANIGALAVGSAAIGNAAIANVHLGTAIIQTGNIVNAAITSALIGSAAVGAAAIAAAAIGSAAIGTAVIQNVHLGTASILDANIASFNFNKGTGGTLTLTEGMSILNATGTTIIDATGLVSDSSFKYQSKYLPDLPSYTGTVWGSVNGSAVGTIVLSRASNILFMLSFTCGISTSYAEMRLNVGGTAQSPTILVDRSIRAGAIQLVVPIGAGSTVYYTEAKNVGAAELGFGGGYLSQIYLTLGV